jgi:alpha-tubulin suppressor-like RCC1 family protein
LNNSFSWKVFIAFNLASRSAMGQGNSRSGIIGWGSSDQHQLASAGKSKLPRVVEPLARGTTAALAVGAAASYSAVLLESGELVTFGKGDSGQLGQGAGEISSSAPRAVRGGLHGKVVRQFSCGEFHCAAVTDNGALFTWGRGQHGRLGHGLSEDEPAPRLVEALLGTTVVQVACGEFHTVCSTGTAVFTFGLGLAGRLGPGTEEDAFEPKQVAGPLTGKQIISVAAGGHHSAAIVQPGALYMWGGASFGKLGHGDTAACLVPKLVTALAHVRLTAVSLGQHHSAALAANGDVYVWGRGQGPRCEDLLTPQRVIELPSSAVSFVSCGKSQVFAVTHNGDVYVRGPVSAEIHATAAGFAPASDATGETNKQQLYVLQGKGVVSLASGDEHCVALADPARVSAVAPLADDGAEQIPTGSSTPVNRPSLYHVLESVVKAVPAPPAKPSAEAEMAFLSEELKFAQIQNSKLTGRLEEAFLRIAHLERENASLREELDASMQCLPVDRVQPLISPTSQASRPLPSNGGKLGLLESDSPSR